MRFDFVISGAGVAGLACARYLARTAPKASIAIVTPHAPMSLTSSLSTECFRDHWPSHAMRAFMQRSIQLINDHAAEADAFRVTRHGYLYVSCQRDAPARLLNEAISCHGADGVRAVGTATGALPPSTPQSHPSHKVVRGADVFTDTASAIAAFPYLTPKTTAAMHARNAGWVAAQTMGMDMLDTITAREHHVTPGGRPLTSLVREGEARMRYSCNQPANFCAESSDPGTRHWR
jgi:glycine/D-amino acid oxidase-like deaminating enzyme